MKINKLKIKNFRNMQNVEFTPCDNVNIILADNAQGKTNLLETAWLFTGAKSFRGAKDSEYIPFSTDVCDITAQIELEFFANEREQNAKIIYGGTAGKVWLNEIKQKSSTSLCGEFCAVVFSPDHLELVKQGPEKRRKLIDISLSQAYPKYIRVIDGYNKSLKQRNALLKDIPRHSSLLDTLEVWDKNIIDYGSYIIAMRAGYIKKLGALASEIYSGISIKKETMHIHYIPAILQQDTENFSRSDFKSALEQSLKQTRQQDIAVGTTTMGPHRDDMQITINDVSARAFGSQGQQRSSVLALKLAECGILEERNKQSPVVLLDDVMSELDEHRQRYLLTKLVNKQIIITCCDINIYKMLDNAQITRMEKGQILL